MQLTENSLQVFKTNTSENKIIVNILCTKLKKYLDQKILDIGAGTGDIAFLAFPEIEAILIDILEFRNFPISNRHKRIKADFFDIAYQFKNFNGTILLSHSIQYLDNRYDDLIAAINLINSKTLITVTNINTGFFGIFIDWVLINLPDTNPEVSLRGFPESCCYSKIESVVISAHVSEISFNKLAKLAAYLIDTSNPTYIDKIESFMRQNLQNPSFEIMQSIDVYKKG